MLDMQKKLSNFFYVILSLPCTAMGFALSIQIAALSWILNTKFQLDVHQIGIVWSAGPIAGIVGQVLIGLISDKTWFWGGRRRPFILIGGTLASLMLLALPNIDRISSFFGFADLMIVAVIVALTLDMAINISFNPTRSIIADVTPDGIERTKGYTIMQTVSGTFGVLAYLIGAVLDNYFLIYFGAVVILIFSLIPIFLIEENKELTEEKKEEETVFLEEKKSLAQFIKIFAAHSFSWLGVFAMFVYMIVYVKQKLFNITDFQAILSNDINNEIGQVINIAFLLLSLVSAILPATVLMPLAKKIGRVKTHTLSILSMGLSYFFLVFFAKDAISLYVVMVLLGIGWASIISLPFAIMSENVNKEKMGLFMGIFNLAVVLPQLCVTLILSSFIAGFSDKNYIFVFSGICLIISAILWTLVKENKN